MILGLFRKSVDTEAVYAVYSAIVAQSRQSCFYAEWGVPDTVTGRFDMICLHVPLTDATSGLLDAARLATMKRGAFLVNAARGGVLDEAARVEAKVNGVRGYGAEVIFATSYGYLDHAIKVGEKDPDVSFLHAGGLKTSANVGTYWADSDAGRSPTGDPNDLIVHEQDIQTVQAAPQ